MLVRLKNYAFNLLCIGRICNNSIARLKSTYQADYDHHKRRFQCMFLFQLHKREQTTFCTIIFWLSFAYNIRMPIAIHKMSSKLESFENNLVNITCFWLTPLVCDVTFFVQPFTAIYGWFCIKNILPDDLSYWRLEDLNLKKISSKAEQCFYKYI